MDYSKSEVPIICFHLESNSKEYSKKTQSYGVLCSFTRIITVLGVEAYAGWEASQWQWALSFATSQPSAVGFSAAITACSKLGRQEGMSACPIILCNFPQQLQSSPQRRVLFDSGTYSTTVVDECWWCDERTVRLTNYNYHQLSIIIYYIYICHNAI